MNKNTIYIVDMSKRLRETRSGNPENKGGSMNTYEAVKQLKLPKKNSKYAKVDLVRLASATEQATAKVYRDLCLLKEVGAIEIVRGREHDKVRVTSPTQQFIDKLPEILNPKVEEKQ